MWQQHRKLPIGPSTEVIAMSKSEEERERERRRLEEIVRRATTDWTPPSIEQIVAERKQRKYEETIQKVGRNFLRIFRRFS